MSSCYRELAPAKLNLTLSVIGRRADGYHLIESLVAFCDFGDEVRLDAASGFDFRASGPFANDIGSDNLIVKTAEMLRQKFKLVDLGNVCLQKLLPVAAGIGGGSADAAALLRIAQNIKPGLFDGFDMKDGLTELGADVPVCFAGHAAWMEGIGERITSVARMPSFHVVLVNPLKQLSTGEVFQAHNGRVREGAMTLGKPGALEFNSLGELTDFMAGRGNDLTDAACSVLPEIRNVLAALNQFYECRIAAMSGSGATCFAIFETSEEAARAAAQISTAHEGWWVRAAAVNG